MSTTFGQLNELFLNIVGHGGYAARESLNWLTLAYREVGARKDVREMFQPAAVQATVAGQDYIELDTDVYSVITVLDVTNAHLLSRESSWADRLRHCEQGEGKPPEGELSHYFPWAKRLYLRSTPADVRDLQISFRFHPPMLTTGDLALYPATPPQYDEAILWLAVAKCDAAHPTPASKERDALGQAERMLGVVREQRAEEKHGMRNSYLTLPGYGFN